MSDTKEQMKSAIEMHEKNKKQKEQIINFIVFWIIFLVIYPLIIKYSWNYLADHFVVLQISYSHALVVEIFVYTFKLRYRK